MAYVGNTPTTQSFISGTDYFSGNGSTVAFTLSRAVVSVNDIEVVINNVVQQPNTAYTISGTTITFTSAPSSGTSNIYVRYLSTTTQSITPSQGTVSYSTLNSDTQSKLGISFKNRIINGGMIVNQYNVGTIAASDGTFAIDRWRSWQATGSGSKGNQAVNLNSVTPPPGFTNYLGFQTTSAYSVSGTDSYAFQHRPEGQFMSDLAWGTVNAKTITLSFWVYSSLTGTFGGAFRDVAATASYPFTYTVGAANTWTQVSITVVGPSIGTWGAGNGVWGYISFSYGTGSGASGPANAWAATGSYWSATGATSVVGTNGATFYITGVQLEVGTQATTFTNAGGSYGTELALCQRYYFLIATGTVTTGFGLVSYANSSYIEGYVSYPVSMRAKPTLSATSGTNYYGIYRNGAQNSINSLTLDTLSTTERGIFFNNTQASGTAGQVGNLYTNSLSAFVAVTAEL